jgi:hypothetical protein
MALSKENMRALLSLTDTKAKAVVLTTAQWEDLQDEGLVDPKRKVTDVGKAKAENVRRLLKELRRGVPAERRKPAPGKLEEVYVMDRDSRNKWVTSSVANKLFTTNREVMIFGPPEPWMASNKEKGLGEKVIQLLRSMGKETYVEVAAAYFQTDGTIEPKESIIWLKTPDTHEGEPVLVSVQSTYYDYLMDRFPSAKIFAAVEKELPLQFRVVNKGISKLNVIALLMPYRMPEDWKAPGGGNA